MTCVAVFIDYQNVYMRARAAFGLRAEPACMGQVDPRLAGRELAGRGPRGHDRRLVAVRVYRGVPGSHVDPRGFAASRRQTAFWRTLPDVEPILRPLKYLDSSGGRLPREKGIDVQLAVDLVLGAVHDAYDCAVIFSADTDLVPALDAVVGLKGKQAVQVAAWRPDDGFAARIEASGGVWCHYLDRAAYERVADRRDYTRPGKTSD